MVNNGRTVLLGCMVSSLTFVICLLLMEIVLRMLPVDSGLLGLAVNAEIRYSTFSRIVSLRTPAVGIFKA
jgi:hypothetical protein